jgi:molybdopterin-guanine dinucleotide biosynthesis protein A
MKTDFTGYVLAGGRSSRMGTDKYALELAGETLLTRAGNTLETACGRVRIVLNERQNIEPRFTVVRDIFEARGALGGIHAALADCETEFALVLAVDLPLVSSDALVKLTQIARAARNLSAVVPRQSDGRLQPICAVYRVRSCLAPLEKLLTENETAAVGRFVDLISPEIVDEKLLSANENLLYNVNFPADFRNLS